MKKFLVFVISLTLLISALVVAASRPDGAVQVFAEDGASFKSVNIIQLLRNLLR